MFPNIEDIALRIKRLQVNFYGRESEISVLALELQLLSAVSLMEISGALQALASCGTVSPVPYREYDPTGLPGLPLDYYKVMC